MTATESPWAVAWETLPWESHPSAFPTNRAERAAMRSTYGAAIPVEIATVTVSVDPVALAASDDARAEISRFDAELTSMLPGTGIAPLAAVLLRTESASSSQIENITARAKALALAELGLAKTEATPNSLPPTSTR